MSVTSPSTEPGFATEPGPPAGAVAGSRRPLVVACLRVTDLRPEVDPLTGDVSHDDLGIGLSRADGAALEHAFRIAETWSGDVLAVAAGPPAIEDVLRDAMALGAAVLRIPVDNAGSAGSPGSAEELAGDERAVARAVVAGLAAYGPPALVLCGDRSADRGTGAFPAFVAHELGAAQALGLVQLGTDDGRPGTGVGALLAERRLDGGWRERLRVPCPAVCSVEGAGVRLRRASLPATLAARRAVVPVAGGGRHRATPVSGSTVGHPPVRVGPAQPFRPRTRIVPAPLDGDPRLRLLALTGALVAHDPPTVVGPIDASGAADALMEYLVRHGYLDAER